MKKISQIYKLLTLKILTLKILSCIAILYCVFCNPRNGYHKNGESHESTEILTFKISRLHGVASSLRTTTV